MLNICCVAVNLETYMEGHAIEAVEILYSMVRRNLAAGTRGRFVVFTDAPAAFQDMAGVETRLLPLGLQGWWNKLALFSKDAFPEGERVLYFDLDTAITGRLDEIAAYTGKFAILRDAYRPGGLQSSVMAWEAGTLTHLWESYEAAGRPEPFGGDQTWIERHQKTFDLWQKLFHGAFRSYKLDCTEFVPRGTSVVYFHGHPRPYQAAGWVKDVWKVSNETMFFSMNVKEERVRNNVTHALSLGCKWLDKGDVTQQIAIVVGGGPSLANDLWRIKGYKLSGGIVYATNNTARFLMDNGITPDAHVMHDARPDNLAFVPDLPIPHYYASQCDPAILKAAGEHLVCWHPHSEVVLDEIGDDPQGMTMVSGGPTIGLNALSLCYILGHRRFELFGFDSCYADGDHHAYSQSLNDGELVLDCIADGKQFKCSPWMIQQADQFIPLYEQLHGLGCEVHVHGTGLIPMLADNWQSYFGPCNKRADAILERLRDIKNPKGAEIGVFSGELSKRLLRRSDLSLLMVDSWKEFPKGSAYGESDFHGKLTQKQQDSYHDLTVLVTQFAGPRARIIREDSVNAAQLIPDHSLDFVFIDADHTYEGCSADIAAWLPKVKPGGWIGGHDYKHPDYPTWGVQKAVNEVFGEPETGEDTTWFVRLPLSYAKASA